MRVISQPVLAVLMVGQLLPLSVLAGEEGRSVPEGASVFVKSTSEPGREYAPRNYPLPDGLWRPDRDLGTQLKRGRRAVNNPNGLAEEWFAPSDAEVDNAHRLIRGRLFLPDGYLVRLKNLVVGRDLEGFVWMVQPNGFTERQYYGRLLPLMVSAETGAVHFGGIVPGRFEPTRRLRGFAPLMKSFVMKQIAKRQGRAVPRSWDPSGYYADRSLRQRKPMPTPRQPRPPRFK